jgi:hypothetical protein
MSVDLELGRDHRRVAESKLKTSAKDCGGLAGMLVLGARDEGEEQVAGGRARGVLVWAGRRDYEGELGRWRACEGDI